MTKDEKKLLNKYKAIANINERIDGIVNYTGIISLHEILNIMEEIKYRCYVLEYISEEDAWLLFQD